MAKDTLGRGGDAPVSREAVESQVEHGVVTYPLNSGGIIELRKLSYKQLKELVASVSGEAQRLTRGKAGFSFADLFTGKVSRLPGVVLEKLVASVTGWSQKQINDADFDEIFGIAGAVLKAHFADSDKVTSFFKVAEGILLQVTERLGGMAPPGIASLSLNAASADDSDSAETK